MKRLIKWFGFAVFLIVLTLILKNTDTFKGFTLNNPLSLEQKKSKSTMHEVNMEFKKDKENNFQAEMDGERFNIISDVSDDITNKTNMDTSKKLESIDKHLEGEGFFQKANKGSFTKQELERYAQLLKYRTELYKELISQKIKKLEENI